LIQKKKDLRLHRIRSWNNSSTFSGQKHTFPWSLRCRWRDRYISLRICGLVYLTWTTLFVSARDTSKWARKHPVTTPSVFLFPGSRNQTEIWPTLGRSNSVDCYFEIALKVTCISLNDVKSACADSVVRLDG